MNEKSKFKILNLGLDSSIIDKNSALAKRAIEYGELTENYTVIVPSKKNVEIRLSSQVKIYGVSKLTKFLALIKIYNLAKNLIKKEKFNIISVQDTYYLALVGWLLARKFKIGLELQVHGFEKLDKIRKKIAQFFIPKADSVRSVSQRLKNELTKNFKAREEQITVIPIYINKNQKSKACARQRSGIKNQNLRNKFIFLTVGRLVLVKYIDLQIKALKNILNAKYKILNTKIELWIAGEGPEKENLEFRIKNLELENNIKLLGWQENLEKLYTKADTFLLTSLSEGWGLAAIEAASYSLPIIMTDVGCANEVIKNNESGIVIPTNNQKALEEAMLKLVNNPDLRKKLGKNARKAVLSLPNKEDTLKLYLKSWGKGLKR